MTTAANATLALALAKWAMCYSAQLESAYQEYIRHIGAEIDFQQFAEVFGARVQEPNIRIPRAVERWFDDPKSEIERSIRGLIGEHRAIETTKLEHEVFVQRKRLADAERVLGTKPTKAAAESKRIASDKIQKAMSRLERLKAAKPHVAEARIFPMQYAPIVVMDGVRRVVRLARYHCRKPGEHPMTDRKLPGKYNARRDSLDKYWKDQFGSTHALMLVNSFFENVERDGSNRVLHFVPRPAETMLIASLCAEWREPKNGSRLLSFAAITDEPPPEVAAAGHDRMIVNLKPEHIDAWLSPAGRSLDELHAILADRQAPYYEHQVMAA